MKINGTEIFYVRLQGKGPFSFVLIHNAGGDHRFFTHQVEFLKSYGDVFLLDLPGHGKSSPLQSYKMGDLSSIITQFCMKLSLKNICLIGLNNGADIAIDCVSNHSLPMKALVLIDAPIFMDNNFINEIRKFIVQLSGETYYDFIDSLVKQLFIETEETNRDIAKSAFEGVDRQSLRAMFEGLIEWNSNLPNLNRIEIPTLCILTDEHHCSFAKMREECPQFEIGKVVGSKCWATLEVPEQVNSMIRRFLQVL